MTLFWTVLILLLLYWTRNIWTWIFIVLFFLGGWVIDKIFELLGSALDGLSPRHDGGYPVMFAKLLTIVGVICGLVYWIRK